jgi:hypothetical protein
MPWTPTASWLLESRECGQGSTARASKYVWLHESKDHTMVCGGRVGTFRSDAEDFGFGNCVFSGHWRVDTVFL